MNQREHQEERQLDLYVLPVVGGAIIGFIIAEWIGISGVLGTLIGAFVVDAFRGLRGTHRFVREAEHLVLQARNLWDRQKSRTAHHEAAHDPGSSQPPPGEKPAGPESHLS